MSKIELLKERADKLGLIVLVNLRNYKGKAILPQSVETLDAEQDERGIYYAPPSAWRETPSVAI